MKIRIDNKEYLVWFEYKTEDDRRFDKRQSGVVVPVSEWKREA